MNVWSWIAGQAQVRLTSADRELAMQTLIRADIPILDAVDVESLTVQFWVSGGHLRKLEKICQRKGWELEICSRIGLSAAARQWAARPVLVLGLVLILFASVYLPSRVLFVRVEGNVSVPARKIVEKASACGIGFGASRQAVRSQKTKDALLDAMPELQWAGVNTAGCVATITVRERAEEPAPEKHTVSSIVAARDGIITEITVTQGTARFTPGQAVKAGEVLISGYTDCGFCIRAQRADGEVFAQTQRKFSAVTPTIWQTEYVKLPPKKKYALIIGKNRINFYKDSGNSGAVCDKMYTEYYITLPGGFVLPVCIVTELWTAGAVQEREVEEAAAQALLLDFSERCLLQQTTAGTVTERTDSFTAGEGIYCLTGNYACIEMIGRQRNEENLIGKYD